MATCTIKEKIKKVEGSGISIVTAQHLDAVANFSEEEKNSDILGEVNGLVEKETNLINMASGEFKDLVFNSIKHEQDNDQKTMLTQSYIDNITTLLDTMQTWYAEHMPAKDIAIKIFEGEETTGSANLSKSSITILHNPEDNLATKSELLLHEALHLLFKGALGTNASLGKSMIALRKVAREKLTADIFLQQAQLAGQTEFNERDIQRAKDKFDYIMTDKADIEEFMAYAYSNSFLYNALIKLDANEAFMSEDSDSLSGMLKNIYNSVMNNYPKDSKELMNKSLRKITEFQSQVIADEYGSGPSVFYSIPIIGMVLQKGDFVFKTAGALKNFLGRFLGITLTPALSKAVDVLFKQSKKIASVYNTSSASGLINELSHLPVIRQVIKTEIIGSLRRQLFQSTATGKYKDLYTMYRKSMFEVDKIVQATTNSFKDIFKNSALYKVDNTSENASAHYELIHKTSTTIFEKGLAPFMDKFTSEYVTQDGDLNARIEELTATLKEALSPDMYKELGNLTMYLHTGKSQHPLQQINVNNVLTGMYELDPVKRKEIAIQSISIYQLAEELVYLRLAQANDLQSLIVSMSELDEAEGTSMLVDTLNLASNYAKRLSQYKVQTKHDVFDPLPMNHIEYDSSSQSHRYELISEEELDDSPMATALKITQVYEDNPEKFIIFGKTYIKAKVPNIATGFEEGGLKITNVARKGLSLKRKIRQSVVEQLTDDRMVDITPKIEQNIQDKTEDILKKFAIGDPKVKSFLNVPEGTQIEPIYNNQGKLIDLIIPYSKKDIQDLGGNTEMHSYLSNTVGRLIHATAGNRFNLTVIETLNDFYKKHRYDDDVEFVTIGEGVKNAEYKKAWELLPTPTKKEIIQITGFGGIKVPKEVVAQIIGFKHATLAEAELFGTKLFNTRGTKLTIMKVESAIASMLSSVKSKLILFNPDVFVGNTISNANVAASYGISYSEYLKRFKDGWATLTDYEETSAELTKLQQLKLNSAFGQVDNLDTKIATLKMKLESSKFKYLVEDGQFTPLVEDMDDASTSVGHTFINSKIVPKDLDRASHALAFQKMEADPELGFQEALLQAEDELTEGRLPAGFGTVIDNLYGSKNTKAFEVANKFVLYGDTLSRQMIIDKKQEEMQKEKGRSLNKLEMSRLLKELDEVFINYGYNNNKYQTYAEKVGGLMFLKYLFKSQKGYLNVFKQNPTSVVLQQGLQAATGIDVADPLDTVIGKDPVSLIENRLMLSPSTLWDYATPNIFMPITELNSNTFYK